LLYLDLDDHSLELPTGGFRWQMIPPPPARYAYVRSCTDLYLDPAGQVWASACHQEGPGAPAASFVGIAGILSKNAKSLQFSGSPYGGYNSYSGRSWSINGFCVEAVGPPSSKQSILSFGTADGAQGGCWRQLEPQGENRY
jgi:hypothetical protein